MMTPTRWFFCGALLIWGACSSDDGNQTGPVGATAGTFAPVAGMVGSGIAGTLGTAGGTSLGTAGISAAGSPAAGGGTAGSGNLSGVGMPAAGAGVAVHRPQAWPAWAPREPEPPALRRSLERARRA